MFQVDRSENRLKRLEQRRFGDLNLREREHLQEWLAHQPDALGEDLLIIQKEFDGFDGTRERLDLLALDKDGQLVVIENKLDDSGRDVAWQALKYTAYVSSLKTQQVVEVFQKYLDRHVGGGSAVEIICDFLEIEDFADVVLNPGNTQRLFFIAANFRREVTSTVLWLREHQIDARCFKVTPFSFGDELLVDIQPVIPTPEAADFMIQMAEKESEEKSSKGQQQKRARMCAAYWELALDALRAAGLSRFDSVSPSKGNWIACGTGVSGIIYSLAFTRTEARVEVNFVSSEKERNKAFFEALFALKPELEAAFGEELIWIQRDDKIQCKVFVSSSFEGFNESFWPEMSRWMVEKMARLQETFASPISTVRSVATQNSDFG